MATDNTDVASVVAFLKAAPHGEIDTIAVDKIKTWCDDVSSLQVLEVLDMCIYGALASPIALTAIDHLYDYLLEIENKTHDDNLPYAHWRNN